MASYRVENLSVTLIFVISMIGWCSSELKLFQSVFRHGDRYPLAFNTTKLFYPLNPHANVSWYPDTDGGLTTEGKQRSYELGNVLRERYYVWFGQRYARKIVHFVSSVTERSIRSALLVAAGLFEPENGDQMWNPTLNWQPVAITTMKYPENILFYGCIFCPKYHDLLERAKFNDSKIIEYDATMKRTYDHVTPKIGIRANNRILYYVYMEFLAAMSGGLTPPEWAEGMFLNKTLKESAIMEYKYSSWTDELKRLTGGSYRGEITVTFENHDSFWGIWLKRWLNHVDDFISESATGILSNTPNREEKKRAFFYSGHDTNVAGIMNTLGIFYPHVPNYASAINLELHDDENQRFYVKVAHRDSGKFIEYKIPGCDDILCPLKTFRNILSNVVTFNATEDCGSYADSPKI